MKLSSLKKSAQRTTALRGHRMQWREPYGRADGPKAQFGKCKHCGKEAHLTEGPAPNGIHTSGEALAMTCTSI